MKNGRLFGFLFMFLGMALTLLLMTMLNDAPGVFRILYAGPLLVGGGLGMMIMPGYQPTDEEWSDKTQRMPLIWNNAPMVNKVVWFSLAGICLILVLTGVIHFNF